MFFICGKICKLLGPEILCQVMYINNDLLTVVLVISVCVWCARITENCYDTMNYFQVMYETNVLFNSSRGNVCRFLLCLKHCDLLGSI